MNSNYYHPCMLADPHGNLNNHNAVLIDRAVYAANVKLDRLFGEILALVRAVR